MQTAYAFQGEPTRIILRNAGGAHVASLSYGGRARIVRINKGLRRRQEKDLYGFRIGTQSGRWLGSVTNDDDKTIVKPGPEPEQKVLPVVEDRKNALLVMPGQPLEPEDVATLQSALARGLKRVFRLEEGEIAVDPVPDRAARNGLLFYEASEGGAGVLSRIARLDDLRQVVRTAIEVMHLHETSTGRTDHDDAPCVEECYRCVLTYFNQPDHELIDRRRPAVRGFLTDLLAAVPTAENGAGKPCHHRPDGTDGSAGLAVHAPVQGTGNEWVEAASRWGIVPPDDALLERGGKAALVSWRRHRTAVASDPALAAALEDEGFVVLRLSGLPADLPAELPAELAHLEMP